MPDITMCRGEHCPRATTCYRHTAESSERRQSWFAITPMKDDKTCAQYVATREIRRRASEIYVISASRGSYSDRAEYDICWSRDEEHAKRLAAEMEAKSNEWRSRMSRCWDWERPEVEAKFKEAMADMAIADDAREALEEALRDACDDADEGWSYASDYFRDKWRDEDAAKVRRVLAGEKKT